jgi:hypothetical protein
MCLRAAYASTMLCSPTLVAPFAAPNHECTHKGHWKALMMSTAETKVRRKRDIRFFLMLRGVDIAVRTGPAKPSIPSACRTLFDPDHTRHGFDNAGSESGFPQSLLRNKLNRPHQYIIAKAVARRRLLSVLLFHTLVVGRSMNLRLGCCIVGMWRRVFEM